MTYEEFKEHAVEVLAEEICKRKNLEGGVVDSENFVLPYSKLIVLCRAEARKMLRIKEAHEQG